MTRNKIIMRQYMYVIFVCLVLGLSVTPAIGQNRNSSKEEVKIKKAWEFGVGGSIFQLTRFNIIDIYQKEDGGYKINTQKKDVLFGGNIYAARELNSHFYLDLQATVGYAYDKLQYKKKENRLMTMAGIGLQWRLGEYFGSKYIDPYFRVGANYMYKNFNVVYFGLEKLEKDKVIGWDLDNLYNKDGADRKHMIPISTGVGVNMWLNNQLGIGIQADYLYMPYKHVANSLQGTARLMWRFGGKSKSPKIAVEYIDREKIIERIVEKPVVVEKVVEKVVYSKLHELISNIYFDFDKSTLTPQSEKVIDEIAEVLKEYSFNKYLITGYTDSKGSSEYNIDLSKRRADTVVKALIDRGVSSAILKSVGVGKKISHMKPETNHRVREGDRKVTIELINNKDYWDKIY